MKPVRLSLVLLAAFTLAACDAGTPISLEQVKQQAAEFGQTSQFTPTNVGTRFSAAQLSAAQAASSAANAVEYGKAKLTAFGETVVSASETAKAAATNLGEAAQGTTQAAAGGISKLGSLVLEATSDSPAPDAPAR